MAAASSRSTLAAPRLPDWLLQNRNFVLLWAAYGISALGDHLSELALLDAAGGMQRDDTTRLQALLGFGFFLPFVLLGPLAGWWADRFSRKWTMIASDLARAVLMANLALIVPWLQRLGLHDYAIMAPLVVAGALAAFFSPARQAMIPTLVRDDQLVRANAVISALGTIATIASAVLGGFLVSIEPRRMWNYRIDAVTFVLSAALILMIDLRRAQVGQHVALHGMWAPLRDGFRYVRQHARVLQMILLGTVFWAAAGVVSSVIPAIVRDVFGGQLADAGIYRGLVGIGLACGAAVMTLLGPALPTQLAVLAALAGGSLWLAVLDAAVLWRLGRLLTGLSLFGIGGAGAALIVSVNATIQRLVPDSRRGRVFGVSDMCTMAAMAAATAALGLPRVEGLDRYVPGLIAAVLVLFVAALIHTWRVYRRGSEIPAITWLLWSLVGAYARLWCGVKRVGPCTIPLRGPVIVAANHTCGVDPMALLATSPHRLLSFLVAEEYYNVWYVKWLMRRVHCVPIDRQNPGKSFLVQCLRRLSAGGGLAIFPQGTFEVPGQPSPPVKSGVAALALRSGAVVVPVHISGATYHENPFAAYFLRHRMRVRYGKPIDLSAFAGRERDKSAPDEVAALIMRRIDDLAADPEPADAPNPTPQPVGE